MFVWVKSILDRNIPSVAAPLYVFTKIELSLVSLSFYKRLYLWMVGLNEPKNVSGGGRWGLAVAVGGAAAPGGRRYAMGTYG